MEVCAGTRRDGLPCVHNASEGSAYCHHHDPDRAEERRRRASKAGQAGGRARSGLAGRVREVEGLNRDLDAITRAVVAGKLSSRQADAATKAINSRLRAIDFIHKLTDIQDIEARLSELEGQYYD